MTGIASYFDLSRGTARSRSVPPTPGQVPVIPQYLALATGVIVEPFLHEYMETHRFAIDWSSAGFQLLFGLFIAIIIFPAVYRNAFDPERPLFVQLCAIFASGIGWQSLFQAATGRPNDGTTTEAGNAAVNAVTSNASALLGVLVP